MRVTFDIRSRAALENALLVAHDAIVTDLSQMRSCNEENTRAYDAAIGSGWVIAEMLDQMGAASMDALLAEQQDPYRVRKEPA